MDIIDEFIETGFEKEMLSELRSAATQSVQSGNVQRLEYDEVCFCFGSDGNVGVKHLYADDFSATISSSHLLHKLENSPIIQNIE